MAEKVGMQLDRVVLLGRTFEEYIQYFALNPAEWMGRSVLDVASGVSSFAAEANERGIAVTACDPIYSRTPEELEPRCATDLDYIYQIVEGLKTYVWKNYRDRDHMRELRDKAYHLFLKDFGIHKNERYVPGALPQLPFTDKQFELSLVSYFLFVYQDQFSYEFHRDSILELMRVTAREARIYPVVTFEAEPSSYLAQLENDPLLDQFSFEIVPTNFEFLRNSNCYLRIQQRNRV